MLDVPSHPSHLDRALDGELAVGLHLPTSTLTAPGADLSGACNDNNFVEVEHALEFVDIRQGLWSLERGEIEGEVGTRANFHGLHKTFGLRTVDNLVVRSIIASNGAAELTLLVECDADTGGDLGKVREAIHATVEVGPERFNLGYREEKGVHQTKQVEGHLLRREGADSVALELLRDNVGRAHKASSTSPAKRINKQENVENTGRRHTQ